VTMEIGGVWLSSTKREAMPSTKESPLSVVSPALVEALVTQDINKCDLLEGGSGLAKGWRRRERALDGRRREEGCRGLEKAAARGG